MAGTAGFEPAPLRGPPSFVRQERCYHPMMDWIPVTDRLPPVGLNVLACSWLAKTYALAYVSPRDGKWYLSFGSTRSMNVTHWMPLPELPQGSVVV